MWESITETAQRILRSFGRVKMGGSMLLLLALSVANLFLASMLVGIALRCGAFVVGMVFTILGIISGVVIIKEMKKYV